MRDLSKSDVFLDVCTQRDYLAVDGASPVVNAAQVAPNVKHLMAFARWSGTAIVSCVDLRRPCEVRGVSNASCVAGTPGQEKIPLSVVPRCMTIESDNCLCVPLDLFSRVQQVVLSKMHRDPFTNPKLDRILTELPVGRFVLFGVSLEGAVRLTSLGLLLRSRRVAVIADACGFWNEADAEMILRQLAAKGCDLLSTTQFIQSGMARLRHGRSRPRGRSVA